MTEAEWLACDDPEVMLLSISEEFSERKLRLLACACVRRIWRLIPDELGRRAVIATEAYFGGCGDDRELRSIADTFYPCGQYNAIYNHPATRAAQCSLYWEMTTPALTHCLHALRSSDRVTERAAQADLVRHIFGNPLRPTRIEIVWPEAVLALATALNAGEPCQDPLHDALLEAGRADLAGHFREKDHPRGCWALDLILGKM